MCPAVFHRISAMGQKSAFHRTYVFVFLLNFLGFACSGFRTVLDSLLFTYAAVYELGACHGAVLHAHNACKVLEAWAVVPTTESDEGYILVTYVE